ncbi:MAG TPA: SDR family NAD(P)-dependent oxidoreductase [Blastocatellia bacterium]|nr:SDR family NAD(P)-dependent oxidoreductase [Blastocatellia bacterium]
MTYQSLFRLDDQVAVVISAGSGLGEVAAQALDAFGARVVCADVNLEAADRVARTLTQDEAPPARSVDITREDEVRYVLTDAVREMGRLDVVITTPRINVRKPLLAEEYTLTGATEWGEQHADMLRKNLVAYLNIDSSASGGNFSSAAVPALAPLIEDVLKTVRDPQTGKTIYERWKSGATEAEPCRGVGRGEDRDHRQRERLHRVPALSRRAEPRRLVRRAVRGLSLVHRSRSRSLCA